MLFYVVLLLGVVVHHQTVSANDTPATHEIPSNTPDEVPIAHEIPPSSSLSTEPVGLKRDPEVGGSKYVIVYRDRKAAEGVAYACANCDTTIYTNVVRHQWFSSLKDALAWVNKEDCSYFRPPYERGLDNVIALLEAKPVPLLRERTGGVTKKTRQVIETVEENITVVVPYNAAVTRDEKGERVWKTPDGFVRWEDDAGWTDEEGFVSYDETKKAKKDEV